jgi:hypothetical protein
LCYCRKPYNPPAIAASGSYLVVEGVINSGGDPTVIRLSKTVPLSSASNYNPVIGATVSVQSNQNNTWPLTGDGKGNYVSPGLNLTASLQYRLSIQTPDGKQYLSDFVPVQSTTPIDSIGYIFKNNAVQLYVNTHDATNNTHYYRWDYTETWQFHSLYQSDYIYDPSVRGIVPRTPAQSVYTCFASDTSSSIYLASTADLSKDIVYQAPLVSIPFNSEKVEAEYSILVNQYALTNNAYQFYHTMKQNTEELGSIFDAQPSQPPGNIHNINNAKETVVGYVMVTNVQSKRIFIPGAVIPLNIPTSYPYACGLDTAFSADSLSYNSPIAIIENTNSGYLITYKAIVNGIPVGFLYTTRDCADCTIRGTKQVPSFWP